MSPRVLMALRLVGLGWYIAACILVGVFAGVWLDRFLDTAPLFILIGLALGLLAAFFGLYRMVSRAIREGEQQGDIGS